MTKPNEPTTPAADEADDALNHALREQPVEANEDFDDAQTASGEIADGEDLVLYSEVRPHLEELVALQAERETMYAERDKMIDLLLYARDRVSSPAVASRMDESLALLGITVIAPELGTPFDASRHEASATVRTEDQARHGTIAEIELAGYSDGDRVVRHPVVTVYNTDADHR